MEKQEGEDAIVDIPGSAPKKTKSPKTAKLSLLDDEDMAKLELSFFNRY